jgi:hypothetical protein
MFSKQTTLRDSVSTHLTNKDVSRKIRFSMPINKINDPNIIIVESKKKIKRKNSQKEKILMRGCTINMISGIIKEDQSEAIPFIKSCLRKRSSSPSKENIKKITFIDQIEDNKRELAEIIYVPSYRHYKIYQNSKLDEDDEENDKENNKVNCKCGCVII